LKITLALAVGGLAATEAARANAVNTASRYFLYALPPQLEAFGDYRVTIDSQSSPSPAALEESVTVAAASVIDCSA